MEKTKYLSYNLSGDDVDKINVYEMLRALPADMKFEIEGGNENLYYAKKKEVS